MVYAPHDCINLRLHYQQPGRKCPQVAETLFRAPVSWLVCELMHYRYPLFKAVKLLWLYAGKIVSDHDDAIAMSLQKFKHYGVSQHEQHLLDRLTTFAAEIVYRSICTSAAEQAGQVNNSTVRTTNTVTGHISTVDIEQWSCDCSFFYAYRLPCPHIIAAARNMRYRMGLYISFLHHHLLFQTRYHCECDGCGAICKLPQQITLFPIQHQHGADGMLRPTIFVASSTRLTVLTARSR